MGLILCSDWIFVLGFGFKYFCNSSCLLVLVYVVFILCLIVLFRIIKIVFFVVICILRIVVVFKFRYRI